jgi:hypothetical protein
MLTDLRFLSNLLAVDFLYKSSGTVTTEVLNGAPCPEATYIPKQPWLPLDKHDLQALKLNQKGSLDANFVALIEPSKELIQAVNDTPLSMLDSEADFSQLGKEEIQKIYTAADAWIKNYLHEGEQFIRHDIATSQRNLLTTTFDANGNHFLGLHVDSWEKSSLDQRHLAANRICINLGRSDRHFLFVNLSLTYINQQYYGNRHNHHYALIRQFLREHPGYPVIRVRVPPLHAYIAPTENIIHDGSTLRQEFFDIQLTYRSKFHYPANSV